jgi:hypothetical protein
VTYEASVIAAGALAAALLAWFVVKAVIGHLIAAKLVEVARRKRRAKSRSDD